jgi:hypothetical protein
MVCLSLVARTGRRVPRVEGIQVDAISSCEHHDSTEMDRAVIAKLMLVMSADLTGIGCMQCLYCTTLDFVVHQLCDK